jgi:hypothetical protein
MEAQLKVITNSAELEGNHQERYEHFRQLNDGSSMHRLDNAPAEVKPKYKLQEYHFSTRSVIDAIFRPDTKEIVIDLGHKQMLVVYEEKLAAKLRLNLSDV